MPECSRHPLARQAIALTVDEIDLQDDGPGSGRGALRKTMELQDCVLGPDAAKAVRACQPGVRSKRFGVRA
jgi:hypothetical protein